ncbi:MAG: aspartate carbamoyltransferase [Spirochaetes bacterium]|jgi:aspartate carbamoyltransferase catalytic subunit|nr:aspartate carbamoyltransferase [Spirochaetota bacterium]
MPVDLTNRDVISITDFSRDEILHLCRVGAMMYDKEKAGERHALASVLAGRSLASMFYEPSTRTRTSFHTAIRELGGLSDGFSGAEGTSVMKKETIRDTITMMGANHFDVVVMRHPLDGSLQWAADVARIPVINGGDGKNEHPTQALLDLLTLYVLNDGTLDGLSIGFGGDLSHGRTIRSLSLALSHFESITIRWAAEDFLGMPADLVDLLRSRGVTVTREDTVRDVMAGVRYYYMTRPQLERMPGVSDREISEMMGKYRIDVEKVDGFDVKVLHPLPVNSEVAEIDHRVYFHAAQAFFRQAEFGIFLRKALLYEILNHDGYIRYEGELVPDLEFGNNRLQRTIEGETERRMFIDRIHTGTVVDHLLPGSRKTVDEALSLENRGYTCITASIKEKRNPFLKTDLEEFSERDLKHIALISPEPTINYIRGGHVVEKFVYLLCENENCVTRVVPEDVPPKFYAEDGRIRCRYCRTELHVRTHKVTAAELARYVGALPEQIEAMK